MRIGLPVRWALAALVPLAIGARAAGLLGVIWFDQDARMSWELNTRPAALAAFRRDAQRFLQAGRGTHAST